MIPALLQCLGSRYSPAWEGWYDIEPGQMSISCFEVI